MNRRRASLCPESSRTPASRIGCAAGGRWARRGSALVRRGVVAASSRRAALGVVRLTWLCLAGWFGAQEAQAAALPGRLHAAMRPGLIQPSRSVERWADGAVLVRVDGLLGVRAWASHPGSCMGPAGPAAGQAARAAAEALISLASVKRSAELEVEGVVELDQRTRSGVECSVELTVSGLERRSAAGSVPKRAAPRGSTRGQAARSAALPRSK